MPPIHPILRAVTDRVRTRSQPTRALYLQRIANAKGHFPVRSALSCANLAHGFAGMPIDDKLTIKAQKAPNIGIVSSYNEMLSAHVPYARFPDIIKRAAREAGGTAQFAGGVPAMCDGVTQGNIGMELSLFSRETIAMSTAIALTHNMFDAALCMGVCDKIVPGLLIGALQFGHLPMIFVPAGPMSSGLSNDDKAKVRQRFATGEVGREALLEAESAAYHGQGTCTFYGTANSNQLLMEIMGLHLPGAAFIHPDAPLRDALTAEAARRVLALTVDGDRYTPIGHVVDEKAVINGIVGLLATGGSTNHTMHLVAIARAAGILIDWDDFDALSAVVPLLARIYPNGKADVNHFHAAGGMAFLVRELLAAGLLHEDVTTVAGPGLARYAQEPRLDVGVETPVALVAPVAVAVSAQPEAALQASRRAMDMADATADAAAPSKMHPKMAARVHWVDGTPTSLDLAVLRPATAPFAADGGLRLMRGRIGRGVIKISAVAASHRLVRAPAIVFDSQEAVQQAFKAGELDRDFVAVVRFQGARANGMPELHQLTPLLGVLQDRGRRVALLTDGRMSGASGKVPAVIHLSPEALLDGPIGKVRTGDMIVLDAEAGVLDVEVDAAEWDARTGETAPLKDPAAATLGTDLFAVFRRAAASAELGAGVFGGMPGAA